MRVNLSLSVFDFAHTAANVELINVTHFVNARLTVKCMCNVNVAMNQWNVNVNLPRCVMSGCKSELTFDELNKKLCSHEGPMVSD